MRSRIWLLCCLTIAPCTAGLTQPQQLGRDIYHQGLTQSGQAGLSSSGTGEELTSIPSSMVPCVNCHGERGGGSREGGVLAPPIQWHSLSAPTTSGPTAAEQHYNQHAFALAVNKGIGRNGQPLNASMPRYLLSPVELSAMITYLKVIDNDHPVGVTSTQIRLQLMLPKNTELAEAMRETIQDYLDLLNRDGGIYGRTLTLNTDLPQPEAIMTEPATTFVTLDLRTSDSNSQQVNQTSSSPFMICLFASKATVQRPNDDTENYALYPHPQNYHALRIKAAKQRGWQYRTVSQANLTGVIAEQQALAAGEQRQWALIPEVGQLEPSVLFKAVRGSDIQTNILIGLRAISTSSRKAAVDDYRGAVFALLPPGTESVTEDGKRILAQLSGSPQRYQNWLQQRLWALSAARLLEASLQQSGRNLTLRGFTKAMQSQVDLITDFGPKLSYSANRRVGNSDVALKRLD